MSERPILMNTDMVRAILEGRKTVTRRAMKPQPVLDGHFWRLGGAGWGDNISSFHPVPCHSLYNRAPYHPGDILWVRETWTRLPETPGGHFRPHGVYYYKVGEDLRPEKYRGNSWHPSIHMPRAAARIFLRVTDVRVERLQSINSQGAYDEGAVKKPHFIRYGGELCLALHGRYRDDFAAVWDNTIRPADRAAYGWEANPWVWVISFERISEEGNQ